MLERKGNMFDVMNEYDVLMITTNGFIKNNGTAVMGAGCAKYARDTWFGIDKQLAKQMIKNGNVVNPLGKVNGTSIWSFPVKHKWFEKADIELIRRSAYELMERTSPNITIALPRPGCGNGKLNWSDVKPILEEIFDDRVTIFTF